MKVTKTALSYLLALAVGGAACAKKPEQKTPPNLLDSKFEKSEFAEGKTFVVGETEGDVGKFINAALEKDQPYQFNLLAGQQKAFALLKEQDLVTFKIHEDALRMYFVDDLERPVAKWPIAKHCRLETKLTDKGEETRYLNTRCADDSSSFNDYNLFESDWNKVQIRSMDDGWENLLAKAEIENNANKFTLTTLLYVDANIKASREVDEEKALLKISGSSLTRARELVVPQNYKKFNLLANVRFESDVDPRFFSFNSENLGDIEVLGEEKTKYPLRLRLTENHVLVEKVVAESDVSAAEKTYAEQLADGNYAVTLAGYPIKKYRLENSKTNGIPDVNIKPIAVPTLAEADTIVIDKNNIKKFSSKEKLDVFPAELFADRKEYYYEKTVVDRPIDKEGNELPFAFELGLQWQSGRVRVHRTKTSIQLVDVNIPVEAGDVDGDKMQAMIEIPVTWVDYRVVTSGADAFLKEEELKDGHPAANQWDQRKWVSIEFNRADNTRDSRSDSYKLNRLELAEGYFGFEVYESDKTYGGWKPQATFKYSLYSANDKGLEGRTYFATDRKHFGFFAEMKQSYGGVTKQYEDIEEKRINVARMYPEKDDRNDGKPTVWFNITDNSPTDSYIQEATQEAVDAWDWAFAEAAKGTGKEAISVKLAKERVGLGDVRYNKVAYYGYDISSQLLGYGPSVADSKTGEIHIATNHIYLRNYREGIWRSLSNYVRSELGQYDDKKLTGMVRYNPETKEYESVFPNQELTKIYMPESSNAGTVIGFSNGQPVVADDAMLANELLREMGSRELSSISEVDAFNSENVLISDIYSNKGRLVKKLLAETRQASQDGLGGVDILSLPSYPKSFLDQVDIKAYGQKARNSAVFLEQPKLRNNPENWVGQTINGCSVGYTASNANTIRDIKNLCDFEGSDLLFRSYLDNLRAQLDFDVNPDNLLTHTEEEEAAFTSCSNLILKKKLVATLVHEFGHNFGLRHNFAASSDIVNFPKDESGKFKFMTASSMDYLGADDDRGFEPGPYDIAAIRYGYYDAVAVKAPQNSGNDSEEIIKLDGRSIEDAVSADAPSKIAKEYAYCTDHETMGDLQNPLSDPKCRKWDRGVTATEQVRDFIDTFNSFMITNASRFDRRSLSSGGAIAYSLNRLSFAPLKFIYDHYRFILNREMLKTNPYLEGLSQADIEKIVADSDNPELKEYHQAAQEVYEFLKTVVLMPAKFCKVTGPNGFERFYDFEQIRPAAFNASLIETGVGVVANKCEEATRFLAKKVALNEAEITVEDLGNLFGDLPFSPREEDTFDRPDIQRGVESARAIAATFITMRGTTSGVASVEGFMPSMLDEPAKRDEFEAIMNDRIIFGQTKPILSEDSAEFTAMIESIPQSAEELEPWLEKYRIPAFARERNLLLTSRLMHLVFANSPIDNINRVGHLTAIPTSGNQLGGFAQQMLGKEVENPLAALTEAGFVYLIVQTGSGDKYYFAHPQINAPVYDFIQKRKQLDNLIKRVNATPITKVEEIEPMLEKFYSVSQSISEAFTANFEKLKTENPDVPVDQIINYLVGQVVSPMIDSGELTESQAVFIFSQLNSMKAIVGPIENLDMNKLSSNIIKKALTTALNTQVTFWRKHESYLSEYKAQQELLFDLITM